MRSKKLEKIIQKYLNENLDEKDLSNLVMGLDKEAKKQLEESIEIHFLLSKEYIKVDLETACSNGLSEIAIKKAESIRLSKRKKRYALLKYAAILIGIIGLTYITNVINRADYNLDSPQLTIEDKSITLQLDNGEVEVINIEGRTQLINKKGQIVAAQQGDKIKYKNNIDSEELVYNELNIPYGKRFQVELSDGTIVHLNSGSSLKYPVKFLKGKKRQVFVTGEAYFKVAEDKKRPFIVSANHVNIQVVGTEFNVSSYKEDNSIGTVLVEGKVQLYDNTESNIAQETLAPGQIGIWNKSERNFKVKEVDTEIYTSWLTGRLVFKNTSFKKIRKKLERHYNVTIVNNDKLLDNNTFNAIFDVESIEEVLETIDRNFGIKYKIINNQILIF